jgi:inosose dehydratase
MFTVPGDGDIDFSAIGEYVRTSGYSGWVVVEAEQDPAKAPPKLYTEKAYQFIRKVLVHQVRGSDLVHWSTDPGKIKYG